MARTLNPLQAALVATGKPASYYARKIAGVRNAPNQVENQRHKLLFHLRQGGASEVYARRVANLLGLSPDLHNLLLLPEVSWPEWARPQQGTRQTHRQCSERPKTRAGIPASPSRKNGRQRLELVA